MYTNIQKPTVHILQVSYPNDYESINNNEDIVVGSGDYVVAYHSLMPDEFYADPESIKSYLEALFLINKELAHIAYVALEHQIESSFEYEEFEEEYVSGFEEWEQEFRKLIGLELWIG